MNHPTEPIIPESPTSDETRQVFANEVIPYWEGRTLREDIVSRIGIK